MNNELMFSRQDFFDGLDNEFHFTLDVCNAKCERYFTPEIDGLKQEWTGTVWCNPPYGREIGSWAYLSAKTGYATVVIPILIFCKMCLTYFNFYDMLYLGFCNLNERRV